MDELRQWRRCKGNRYSPLVCAAPGVQGRGDAYERRNLGEEGALLTLCALRFCRKGCIW